MKTKTLEFLKACKEVGYEKVTIFVRDERVPPTMKIKDGSWFGKWGKRIRNDIEEDYEQHTHKVVCGYPPMRCENTKLGGNWSAMWQIVNDCGLVVGLKFGGCGLGDAHDIEKTFIEDMDAGYYDLATI